MWKPDLPEWQPPSDGPPRLRLDKRTAALAQIAVVSPLLALLSGPALLVYRFTNPSNYAWQEHLLAAAPELLLLIFGPLVFSALAYGAALPVLQSVGQGSDGPSRRWMEWARDFGIAGMLSSGVWIAVVGGFHLLSLGRK